MAKGIVEKVVETENSQKDKKKWKKILFIISLCDPSVSRNKKLKKLKMLQLKQAIQLLS